jgi:sRNA-binding protein
MIHRDEREEIIRHLADVFPRCFFERGYHRLPLKHGIADDLQRRPTSPLKRSRKR